MLATLFLKPLPLWDFWYLLLPPLCLAVSVVYKCVKFDDLRKVPREALKGTLWILLGMIAVAIGLAVLVWIIEARGQ